MSTFGMCQAWKSKASSSELGASRKLLHMCAVLHQSGLHRCQGSNSSADKVILWPWTPSSFSVPEVKAQTCINYSASEKRLLPVQKEKLTASSEKNFSVSILDAGFWSDSTTQLAGKRSQICIYRWILYGRKTCGDFSLHRWPAYGCCVGDTQQDSGTGCSWTAIVWSILQVFIFLHSLFIHI